MTFNLRLKEERKRLKLNQTQLAEIAKTTKSSQIGYEKGKNSPSAAYLEKVAAAGLDVQYCLTGVRSNIALAPSEQLLLQLFREIDSRAQKIILSAVTEAAQSTPRRSSGANGNESKTIDEDTTVKRKKAV